jgi:hypothetical protein
VSALLGPLAIVAHSQVKHGGKISNTVAHLTRKRSARHCSRSECVQQSNIASCERATRPNSRVICLRAVTRLDDSSRGSLARRRLQHDSYLPKVVCLSSTTNAVLARSSRERKMKKSPPLTFSSSQILKSLRTNGGKVKITLAKGETAWHPASTSRVVYGPCIVEYRRYDDGGVVAWVD